MYSVYGAVFSDSILLVFGGMGSELVMATATAIFGIAYSMCRVML